MLEFNLLGFFVNIDLKRAGIYLELQPDFYSAKSPELVFLMSVIYHQNLRLKIKRPVIGRYTLIDKLMSVEFPEFNFYAHGYNNKALFQDINLQFAILWQEYVLTADDLELDAIKLKDLILNTFE